jgi:hypothetical protein
VHEDGRKEKSFESVLTDRENDCNDILVHARSPVYSWPIGSEEKLAFYAALLFRRATQQRTFNEKTGEASLMICAKQPAILNICAKWLPTSKLSEIFRSQKMGNGLASPLGFERPPIF